MLKPTKAIAAVTLVIGALAAAPSLYAHETDASRGSKSGAGMMGMMGHEGSMPMMEQMTEMMKHCNEMMQSMDHGAPANSGERSPGGGSTVTPPTGS